MGGVLAHISVRIISTSSTNTRHKHIASNTKRSEDNTNTNIQIRHENHWIDCIYHAASYGFSTFWSVSFPRWTTLYYTVEEIELPLSDGLSAGIGLRQDVVTTRGRKLALIPLADLADIGLGVQ